MAISKIKTNSLDDTAVSNAKLGADAVDATKVADDAVSGQRDLHPSQLQPLQSLAASRIECFFRLRIRHPPRFVINLTKQ